MAAFIPPKDRVRESSTTTGTTDFTLGGEAAGFDPFSDHMANGDMTPYAAILGTTEWETGLGTKGSGTLERTIVTGSSNAGAKVTFSAGTKDVFMDVTSSVMKGLYGSDRRNILLNAAAIAKCTGSLFYQRGENIFATGFGGGTEALDGLKTASCANYTLDSSNKLVKPFQTGLGSRISSGITPTAPMGGTAANANDNSSGTTVVSNVLTSMVGVETNSRIFVKFDLGSDKSIGRLEAIGALINSSTGAFQFHYSTAAQGGGSGAWTQYGSDIALSGSAANYTRDVSVTARYVAITLDQQGYGGAQTAQVGDFNVYPPAAPDNMTLVTLGQIPAANPKWGRVLMEVEPVDSITINTDLIAYLTANNDANYVTGVLSNYEKLNRGAGNTRYLLETLPIDVSANTGVAGIMAKVVTANNKSLYIYRLGFDWAY